MREESRSRSIAPSLVPASNNFDALRFWAALTVLWSHAVPLSYGTEQRELLFSASGGQSTLGMVAVTFFFVISGYLITRSFERSSNAWRFVIARALRIMPALLVVLVLVAFVVGPLVTTLPLSQYLHSGAPFDYVSLQATFLHFVDGLPGVFAHNPQSYVNGSLWTLRYEVECYVLVFALGVAGLLNRYLTLALYVGALAVLAVQDQNLVFGGAHGPAMNFHLDFGAKFLAGALVYQWQVPLKGKLALFALALVVPCIFFGQLPMAQRILLPYAVMYLATGMPLRVPSPARWGDLSYGTYIYAWPVQQLVVLRSHQPHWLWTAIVSTPIVLLLAWLSWHFVEKGALARKDRAFPSLGAKSASQAPATGYRPAARAHQ